MFAAIFAAAANISLNFALIPALGLSGSAWATAGMSFVCSLVYALLLHARLAIPVSWAFPAMIPAMVGAALISTYGNPFPALAACLALSILILAVRRESVRQTILFARRFSNV
jgi:O-antigen/teichoic acid export membrane protein